MPFTKWVGALEVETKILENEKKNDYCFAIMMVISIPLYMLSIFIYHNW